MIDSQPSRDLARSARRPRPDVVDARADLAFRALARARGLDPDARFVGGYVAWEWRHARHVFDGIAGSVRGRAVLELGCNVGATAIVLAALGAEVTAIDPDLGMVELARANAARHGLGDAVRFEHVPDTTCMPFADAKFAWVSCNSVLEYVAPEALSGVLAEVDRVLAPRGIVAILGTSNRLWPREQHTGRWLAHWLPPALAGRRVCRGVTAATVRRALRGYEDLIAAGGGELFVELKARMGAHRFRLAALRHAARLAHRVGVSPGALGPTLTMLLRKT